MSLSNWRKISRSIRIALYFNSTGGHHGQAFSGTTVGVVSGGTLLGSGVNYRLHK